MQFTKRSIERFKTIYINHFGKEFTEDEMMQKASYLVEIYRVAYGMPDITDIGGEKESSH